MVASIAGTNSFASAWLHHNAFLSLPSSLSKRPPTHALLSMISAVHVRYAAATSISDTAYLFPSPLTPLSDAVSECPHSLQLIMNSFVPLILVDSSRLE